MSPRAPRDPAHDRESADEPPPVFGTWPAFYGAVLVNLVAMIALLVWFTKALE
jgi:hypothetical protein